MTKSKDDKWLLDAEVQSKIDLLKSLANLHTQAAETAAAGAGAAMAPPTGAASSDDDGGNLDRDARKDPQGGAGDRAPEVLAAKLFETISVSVKTGAAGVPEKAAYAGGADTDGVEEQQAPRQSVAATNT